LGRYVTEIKFSRNCWRWHCISNLVEIRSVVLELNRAGGQTRLPIMRYFYPLVRENARKFTFLTSTPYELLTKHPVIKEWSSFFAYHQHPLEITHRHYFWY